MTGVRVVSPGRRQNRREGRVLQAHRNSPPPACPRSRKAFTYVEVVLSIGLLAVVMCLFVVGFESASDSFMTSSARGILLARMARATAALGADLMETDESMVRTDTTGSGLSEDLCAIVMPSARDAGGTFHVGNNCRPDWQAVIIYCPYTTAKGVSQLRRYVYYDDDGAYAFPFSIAQITAGEIQLQDNHGSPLTMSRPDGNTTLETGREYNALCPGITGLELSSDSISMVTLRASCLTRRARSIDAEVTRNVAVRN